MALTLVSAGLKGEIAVSYVLTSSGGCLAGAGIMRSSELGMRNWVGAAGGEIVALTFVSAMT